MWTVSTSDLASLTDGNYMVTADVSDAAGNPAPQATDTLRVDETPPTVALTTDDSALNIGDSATITLTFSEQPASLPTVTPSSGSLSSFTMVDATTYTATLTPPANTASGTISFTVGAFTDLAGNDGSVSSAETVAVDTLAPTVGIDAVATDDVINIAERDATVTVTGTNDSGSTVTLNGNAVVADRHQRFRLDGNAERQCGCGRHGDDLALRIVVGGD
ncbi:MAG: Ig-like domain-containing protein [Pseudolabrys sp.]